MVSLPPVKIPASDKLRVLRRLDAYRRWESLDDQRQCIQCGEIITGRDIEIVGGTRELGPLRLQCPTRNCPAIPMDWIMPNGLTSAAHAGNGTETGAGSAKAAHPRNGDGRMFAAFLRRFRFARRR